MGHTIDNLIHINGTSLYAIKEGRGEAIVFMHGFGLDHRMWEKQMTALRDQFTVISYDLRGFGKSALLNEQTAYSHEDDYLALLQHFNIDRAHIVGSSMGGRMALRCALTCPHAVSSLILLDGVVDGHTWSGSWKKEWDNIISAAKNLTLDMAREFWMNHSLFIRANTNPAVAAELKIMIEEYSGWHWINKDPAVVPKPLSINQLENIAVPILAVIGEHDIPDFHEVTKKLSSKVPSAQRLFVPGSGHMVNMESPAIINKAILHFLNDIKQ